MSSEGEDAGLQVDRFRDYLLFLARAKLGRGARGRVEASDVVQVTMLEAHRKRDQFRGRSEGELAGWLRQMLAYNIADAARAEGRAKRNARRARSLEDEMNASSARLVECLAAGGSSPSLGVRRQEDAVRLATALAALPEAQREAVIMRHYEGCPLEEIARRLDRTPAAAAGLLKRGLRQMREALEERD